MTQYNYLKLNGHEVLSVLLNTGEIRTITRETHPNFDAVLDAARNDEDVDNLVDVQTAVATRLEALTDRVSVANGQLYFDGDVLDDVYAKDVVRALGEGSDFIPFVKFLEKVYSNPSFESREQLTNWLKAQDITINEDGNVVSYKSVEKVYEPGEMVFGSDGDLRQPAEPHYLSHNSGTAYVNGERQNGRIKQRLGDRVSMPRSEVNGDGSVGCSTGLHAGAWTYASTFGGNRATILEVEINPVDFVSVPHDSNHEKARVCAYRVVRELTRPHLSFVSQNYYSSLDEDFDDDCEYYNDEDAY